MRIVCQSCSAAYAIDDRHVTPRGVRAQCPRCKHQQVVRREPADAAAPPPAAPAAPVQPPRVETLGPPAAPPHSVDAPPAAAPSRAAPVPAAAPPPRAAASTFSPPSARAAPPVALPTPRAAAAPPARAAAGDLSPALRPGDDEAPPAAPVERLELPLSCQRCGGKLEEPLEQALGTCSACSMKETQAGAPEGEGAGLRIALRTQPLRAGAAVPPLESRSGLPIAPLTAQRESPAPRRRWLLLLAAAGAGALVLGGVAAYALRERARVQREATREKPLPEAVQAVLPRWRLRHPQVQGSAAQQLAAGQRLLARDEQPAYAQAEEAFQRALLLDPRSDEAIAGYAQALALGHETALEPEAYAEALELVRAAKVRSAAAPRLQLAHAALLQTRPGEEEQQLAQRFAEVVLADPSATPRDKAEAHRLLGHAFARSSLGLAEQHFAEALALAPDFMRIHREEALAAEAAGDYRKAIAALERRLARDAGHRESVEALARVFVEVGELPRARALYAAQARAYPKELRAQLPLAVLRYQVDGAPGPAATSLRALLRERAQQPPADVAVALVHLAAAERAAGRAAAAERAVQEALAASPELPEAHLQGLLLALERRDAAGAAAHLAPARAGLGDAALGQVLAGRLALLQGSPVQALEAFQEAYRLDGRRTDALLLAGVAAAGAGRKEDATRALLQALQADPLRTAPRPAVTRFYLQPHDTLRGVEGSLGSLRSGPEDVAADLYEGVLRFHQGALPEADRLLQRVLAQDTGNAQALSYRALVALARGEAGGRGAQALAERAVAQDRRFALAQLALGLSLAAQGQGELGQRALREALTLAPSLLSAEVRLAQLEAGSAVDSARTRLVRTVGLDPSYLEAKRALFALEQ